MHAMPSFAISDFGRRGASRVCVRAALARVRTQSMAFQIVLLVLLPIDIFQPTWGRQRLK
jgi:hypothetical protein